MRKGWRIGSLFGIPLFLDSSWFIILAWVTYLNSQYYQNRGPVTSWGVGLAIALLLFASVILHELGHSLVAMSKGIKVNSITLFLFGGVAAIEREPATPGHVFQVAIAGPAVSFTLFLLLGFATLAIPESSLASDILHRLAAINLVLALFNMIPGLPLDGGQVLKAAIWKITGNRQVAVRWAAKTGQFLGWFAIALGLTAFFFGGDYGGIWIALIGWFALRNATAYNRASEIQGSLLKTKAADTMTRNFRVVDANLTLQEFADKYLENSQTSIYFATREGRYRGLVSLDALPLIDRNFWQEQTLNLILRPLQEIIAVSETASLLEVVNSMTSNNLSWITVLSPAGSVAGTIDKGDIVLALARSLQLKISEAEIKRVKEDGRYPAGLPLEAIAKATPNN
ncbi:MAG: site-2 protease family protein [Cyanobacteriota bacterium]|nr:site-2 protease family protein [Cyanobacteriota bacterium]